MYSLANNINSMMLRRTGAASESPLQAATIAAWDMQESSGPLLPAKGSIEIPAFNSPGTAAGPVTGISARDFVGSSTQYFGIASQETFVAPSSGVKTFRCWSKMPVGSGGRPVFSKGKIGDSNNAEYSVGSVAYSADTSAFVRNAANSSTVEAGPLTRPDDDWFRIEMQLDADAGQVRLWFYDLTAATSTSATASLADFHRSTDDFRIGFDGAFSELDGQVALFSIFNRALTAA